MTTCEIINLIHATDICAVSNTIYLTGRGLGVKRLIAEDEELKALLNSYRIAQIDVEMNNIGEDCVVIDLEELED